MLSNKKKWIIDTYNNLMDLKGIMLSEKSQSQKIIYIVPWPGCSVGWSIVPYTKMLQARSLVGVRMGGNESMFLFLPHIDVSLSLRSLNTSSGEDLKEEIMYYTV